MNPISRAERYIEKGKYKQALKLLAKTQKKYETNLDLARIRFDYGKYIPFDDLHHQAAVDYFNLQIRFEVSGQKIHDDFAKYMSTTQGRIQLDEQTLIRLSVIFASYGFENNAVYLINRMIRAECKDQAFVDALVALINYFDEKDMHKKTDIYVDYLKFNFPNHEMTEYVLSRKI